MPFKVLVTQETLKISLPTLTASSDSCLKVFCETCIEPLKENQ